MSGSETADGQGQVGGISSQLAFLVPSFDPSKDDLQLYQQKVQLVLSMSPPNKILELTTRLVLNTTGSAFSKLQLHQSDICVNEEKGVKRIVELLGGHWGKTSLEKDATMQSVHCTSAINFKDESHYSFLARANILWTKLKTQNLKIEDLQAYVMLRGALISGDDQE